MDKLRLVSISFHTAGKVFDFDAKNFTLEPGDTVVVETERGRALGKVVREIREIDPEDAPPKLKAVLRQAEENDLAMADANADKEAEALKFCQQRVLDRKMEMKLVRAEYLFDGSKIIFYFTADGRVDFRELVRDLAQHFRTRIEMRQIGVRDEAKLVGGLGVCGRELCCASHLRSFAPVSVKMAKAQGLALNPSKISGQCGRLLCCLAYEYETYNDLRKNLPKCGKKIQLESGTAEVIALDVLAQKMTVCCANGDRCQVHVDELKKGFDKAAADKAKSGEKDDSRSSKEQQKPRRQDSQERQEKQDTGDDNKQEERRSRRPRNRNRNRKPKNPQQQSGEQQKQERPPKTEKPTAQTQQTQKPSQDKSEQDKNQQRKRRRRPRRRTNKPKQPENNSPQS
ncbi:Cell fate regulator YaaT, PSP1 superfamily (controls sporulation, competence, biofilm development) [Malonomonas rubra DSM 5091]|uniref:Cell fate regulator YaaT, PSP1 superfamily (Controls sporulation, competence, biofilm development) n=1 Tax=Malonomonas rubra DSM 5091 TaxID=1122189 RepID=A0A1M6DGT9_MALRU|nr:stage 0 sporulation family protein [Malonomonas rubra]SHI72390.1 Cell fate regulator YaaT, PSP1 superfamily (controls sporulation, competence, biofilm development) [Malonomonas rubra DSM 5091]